MVSASSFLLVLLPLAFPYIFHQSSQFAAGDEDLIQKTCANTQYPDLCISSIQSDPSNATADIQSLAVIVLSKAKDNATATFTFVNELLKNETDPVFHRVLELCVSNYSNASYALERSLQDMASDQYDYAAVETSAAAEYLSWCHDGLKAIPGLMYSPELGEKEEVVVQLCGVAVGILNLLPSVP